MQGFSFGQAQDMLRQIKVERSQRSRSSTADVKEEGLVCSLRNSPQQSTAKLARQHCAAFWSAISLRPRSAGGAVSDHAAFFRLLDGDFVGAHLSSSSSKKKETPDGQQCGSKRPNILMSFRRNASTALREAVVWFDRLGEISSGSHRARSDCARVERVWTAVARAQTWYTVHWLPTSRVPSCKTGTLIGVAVVSRKCASEGFVGTTNGMCVDERSYTWLGNVSCFGGGGA